MIVPKNTVLFKGVTKNSLEQRYEKPTWFSFDKEIADGYAKNHAMQNKDSELYQIELKDDLKLINILDFRFRFDFWNKCNMIFNENNTRDDRNIRALMPLGIPSLETLNTFCRETKDCNKFTKAWAELLGGHRCSSFEGDEWMVSVMRDFYKDKCDGYILPFNVPSCFHEGENFAREVCIFNPKAKIKTNTLIGIYKCKAQTGGGYLPRREQLTNKDWDKIEDEIYEDYKGPRNYEQFLKYKFDKMFKELSKKQYTSKHVPTTVILKPATTSNRKNTCKKLILYKCKALANLHRPNPRSLPSVRPASLRRWKNSEQSLVSKPQSSST